jgi:hypothetical protein
MGVRMLRVSVAAAPGTGVGSAPNRVEQPAATTDTTTATASTAGRTTTSGKYRAGCRDPFYGRAQNGRYG